MQPHNAPHSRVRRTVNDLVMAEMFLVQATIESATVIGNGINELSKQFSRRDETGDSTRESVSEVLQRIADDAVEPYSSRFRYFRELLHTDD